MYSSHPEVMAYASAKKVDKDTGEHCMRMRKKKINGERFLANCSKAV